MKENTKMKKLLITLLFAAGLMTSAMAAENAGAAGMNTSRTNKTNHFSNGGLCYVRTTF